MAYLSAAEIAERTKNRPDICEHKILRTGCLMCPQVPSEKDIEVAKLKAKIASQKFVLRNFVTENMATFCTWDLYVDPKTGKTVNGRAIFTTLLAMCQHAWAEETKVWPGDKTLAAMTGLSANYVENCKRTMRELGIISFVGQSHLHTDIYSIKLDKLKAFVELAKVRINAPPAPDWMEGFVPDPEGDNFEELREFAEQDEESADIDTDAGDNPDSSNGEQQ